MKTDEWVENRDEYAHDVVYFEYPDESDLSASSENLIRWNLTLLARVVELFVCRNFHQIVIERHNQLLINEFLKIFWSWFYLIVFEFGSLSENFNLFVQNNVADVVFWYFAYLQ